ncbi:hypothetical protein HY502_03150 [Candidatus Woesebacteria bacterium]|nr:hypothetical protein [Candidatus Woesebacteria bacterium]
MRVEAVEERSNFTWEAVKTESQKRRLVRKTITEINKLKKSDALKEILSREGINIAYAGGAPWSSYHLRMVSTGQIFEDVNYPDFGGRSWDNNRPIQNDALPSIIEQYRLTPQLIINLRKGIEA